MRKENLDGVYDIHTNYMQYPKIMQPSHARWENVPPLEESKSSNKLVEDMSALHLINGATPKADDELDTIENNEAETQISQAAPEASNILPPVPAIFTRHFAITDVHYETAESSTLGRPGPDGDVQDVGTNGLISMANPQHPEFFSAEVLAELPSDCKDALVDAAVKEYAWKSKWRTESTDAARARFLKSYSWFP